MKASEAKFLDFLKKSPQRAKFRFIKGLILGRKRDAGSCGRTFYDAERMMRYKCTSLDRSCMLKVGYPKLPIFLHFW